MRAPSVSSVSCPHRTRFVHRLSGPNLNDGGSAPDEWTFERLPIEIGPLYREYVASSSGTISTSRRRSGCLTGSISLGPDSDSSSRPTGRRGEPPTLTQWRRPASQSTSPFDHDEQSAVVLMSHLPLPVPVSQDQFCEELGADQVGFLSLSGGRTLGFFAARARMK